MGPQLDRYWRKMLIFGEIDGFWSIEPSPPRIDEKARNGENYTSLSHRYCLEFPVWKVNDPHRCDGFFGNIWRVSEVGVPPVPIYWWMNSLKQINHPASYLWYPLDYGNPMSFPKWAVFKTRVPWLYLRQDIGDYFIIQMTDIGG